MLEANSVGSGPAAVVFLHEFGGPGMCDFWPYAQWLTAHRHVLAVLVNRCGYGWTQCRENGEQFAAALTAPAVEWARAHGARRVTLVGASAGASDALQAAGSGARVDAVVALSPDNPDTGGGDDDTSGARLRVPTHLVVAPSDYASPLADVEDTYRHLASPRRQLVVVSELKGRHGIELVTPGSRVRELVAGWVTGAG